MARRRAHRIRGAAVSDASHRRPLLQRRIPGSRRGWHARLLSLQQLRICYGGAGWRDPSEQCIGPRGDQALSLHPCAECRRWPGCEFHTIQAARYGVHKCGADVIKHRIRVSCKGSHVNFSSKAFLACTNHHLPPLSSANLPFADDARYATANSLRIA